MSDMCPIAVRHQVPDTTQSRKKSFHICPVPVRSPPVVGGSIGLAIALGLKRAPLLTISAVAVGALGYLFGGPIGAYLAAVLRLFFNIIMKRLGWVKDGDMKLQG